MHSNKEGNEFIILTSAHGQFGFSSILRCKSIIYVRTNFMTLVQSSVMWENSGFFTIKNFIQLVYEL